MRTTRTSDEFLAELGALVKQQGISGLSVADMAARLRCSRRRLYDVAPTKEGLLLAVARQHFQASLAAGFQAAQGRPDPAQRLMAYLDGGLQAAQGLSPAFLSDLQALEAGRQLFDQYQRDRSDGARRILDEGVRSGAFQAVHAEVVTEVLLGAAARLRAPDFLARTGLSVTQAFREAYALVLEGLLVRQAPAPSADAVSHAR